MGRHAWCRNHWLRFQQPMSVTSRRQRVKAGHSALLLSWPKASSSNHSDPNNYMGCSSHLQSNRPFSHKAKTQSKDGLNRVPSCQSRMSNHSSFTRPLCPLLSVCRNELANDVTCTPLACKYVTQLQMLQAHFHSGRRHEARNDVNLPIACGTAELLTAFLQQGHDLFHNEEVPVATLTHLGQCSLLVQLSSCY